MKGWDTVQLTALDKKHLWHPFTPMREWCAERHEPLLLVEGRGAILRDSRGREYIDGNSSIWTNVHGHAHPTINRAIQEQLEHVAHTSFLGATNPPAVELASALVRFFPADSLTRVFFSDDGSTAMEAAIKMATQYWQLVGDRHRRHFVAFAGAYHGDSLGASSLGGIASFHNRFSHLHFPVTMVRSLDELPPEPLNVAGVVIEPLIQGAAGMKLWPPGLLRRLRDWCDTHGTFLICDEVLTGFGRTGTMFACEQEDVVPDFMTLAKGLSGGYLPLAATLTTERVFEAFFNTPDEDRTFYYGHSYTGNQLGCAAALASLQVFEDEAVIASLGGKIARLQLELKKLAGEPPVFEVRQCGFIAGIELRQDAATPFDPKERMGAQVCVAARENGLLTRPIGDVVVLMPPFCITDDQIHAAVGALLNAIKEVLSR